MNGTGFDHLRTPKVITGLVLVALAALMLVTDATIAAPITMLVVGIVLIAISRREGQSTRGHAHQEVSTPHRRRRVLR